MSNRVRRRRQLLTAAGFLLPSFLGFALFVAGPVLFSLLASFTNWNLQRTVPFQFVGLRNFRDLLGDSQFWLYFVNTLYFMLGMPLAIGGALFLAIVLDQRLRGSTVYRTLFYLPSITSGIALMILWKSLYNPEFGPINQAIRWVLDTFGVNSALGALGLPGVEPPQWLLSTRSLLGLEIERVGMSAGQWGIGAREAIMIMGIWTAVGGADMLLYLAALSNVPRHLYDAAAIDGAGRWATFRYVTWPQLAPTTFFIVVMNVIAGMQGGFEQARVMTLGGPAGTTTTLAYYIYNKAFEEFQLGYASAVSWVLFLIIFTLTMLNWRFGQRDVSE